MMMKKLSEDHYIVVDDSEIKEGDWYLTFQNNEVIGEPRKCEDSSYNFIYCRKITHSTQPLGFLNEVGLTTANLKPDWTNVEYLPLSEVKELLGIVDVEKKALEISPVELDEDEFDVNETHRVTWIDAYTSALEDNKEKKYTNEDMLTIRNKLVTILPVGNVAAWDMIQAVSKYTKWFDEYVESLQLKTEWEVEFVDEKLRLK